MSAVSRKTSSPQWKNFQPPAVQDPAIVSYQRAPNLLNNLMSGSPPTNGAPTRETGVIEKLLHSYGFVQCCDRDARLFFHYSEFKGDMDAVNIGDAVEFQMSFDRRSGRPIAVDLIRVDVNSVSCEVLSEERYIGSVVQEAKPPKQKNGMAGSVDGLGRVTYEHNGEFFFIPYALDDIVDNGNTHVKPGDQVTFFIATDKRNGNLHARKVEPVEAPMKLQKFEGVVCSMKDSFGFIERADAVKEIFFHYSEYMGNINELLLGDDVEFEVQTRNGKEVAVNITPLPEGTVIFEDISREKMKGKIIKTLKQNRRLSDPLGGRIQYETAKGPAEIPYGDKDQKGDYTLQQGDIIEFSVATDRRDKLQRATNIVLLDETFDKTTERREAGTVVSLKDGYGFIQCAERDARMFYHFSEILDTNVKTELQDEVEFTVMQDPTSPSRQVASRIKHLPKGTIGAVKVLPEKFIGTIDKEASGSSSPSKNSKSGESNNGTIIFDYDGAIQKIPYHIKDVPDLRSTPRHGDKVDFNIGEVRKMGGPSKMAVNVRVVLRNITGKSQGFIATLKDNYGFIENSEHDKEVFFHFSAFEGNPIDLDLGDEVEYTLTRKSAKLSAENIHRIPKGSIPAEELVKGKGVLQGKIIRPMRIVDPNQEEYAGLIQLTVENNPDAKTYPYGITSLTDKRDFLQKGDVVKFQIAAAKNGAERAVNVAAVRKYIRAKVESVKDKYGFLSYEAEEGKKLFFHMTEVHDGAEIGVGDEVEFVVVQNQRNGKYSACSLRKISIKRRPERLLSRLKSMNDEMVGPRVVVIRPPKGPDGTPGFAGPRVPWKPPA